MTAPNTEIHFSQVREDPNLELRVIETLAERLGRPLRVLAVGSGGCTALSMLASESVAHIDAVDINPAQLQLIELKRTALAHLELDDQLALLGEAFPRRSAEERVRIYDTMREHLPEATRSYWDARRAEIGYGLNRVGRFDRLVREIGDAFAEIGLDPLKNPARARGSAIWNEVFQRVFDSSRLKEVGNAMTAYASARSFAHHFSQAFAYALRRFADADNYFLHQVFNGGYDREKNMLPPWLLEQEQSAIRAHGTDRLRLHRGNFLGRMLELRPDGGYDFIQVSDLPDWMPAREAHQLLRESQDSLADGGAVLGRRLNGKHALGELMGRYLAVDSDLSAQLHHADRSFLYSEVVVAFNQPSAAA